MAVALCSAVSAHAATDTAAASNSTTPTEVTEVVVTGSYLAAGTPKDAAIPVDVINSKTLQQQGSPTIVQLIKTIPSAGSSFGESNRFLSPAGTATVNLRGLGNLRTLVLFNSRRMVASVSGGSGNAVDINLLPTAAIGRVEVLRDGAAATYGSDAVSGVVNFITRTDLNTLEIDGKYSAVDGSSGDYNTNLAWGWKGDHSNLLLTFGYRHRSELTTQDRPWALQPFLAAGIGGWSSASNPGGFLTLTPGSPNVVVGANGGLPAGTSFTTAFQDPGCVGMGGTIVSGTCKFQYTRFDNLVNPEDHYQAYAEFNTDVTDNIKFHSEILWARHIVTDQRISPANQAAQLPAPINASGGSPGGGVSPYPAAGGAQQSRFYIPTNNPGLIAMGTSCVAPLTAAVCSSMLANGAIASPTAWRPFGYSGNLLYPDGSDRQGVQADALRISGGFKGKFGGDFWGDGIGFDVNLTYGEVRERQFIYDYSIDRLQLAYRGLGGAGCDPVTGTPGSGSCHFLNPFSNAYGTVTGTQVPVPSTSNALLANDPAVINWTHVLLQTITTDRQVVLDTVFNGKLPIHLPGGAVSWALGGQIRTDRETYDPNNAYDINVSSCPDSLPYGDGLPTCSPAAGSVIFFTGQLRYDIQRSVKAVFGEVRLPILDNLEVNGAVRYESYGGTLGATTNPRVSVRYKPFEWLTFRGSAGTTFRAPSQNILVPGAFSRGLVNFTSIGVYRPVDTYNNPNLKPETANTYNVGAVVEKGGFTASIDYYKFQFKNEITTEVGTTLLAAMFPSALGNAGHCGDAAYADLQSRFNFGGLSCGLSNFVGVSRANWINGPSVDTSGIDFSAQYTHEIFGGNVSFGGDATYLIDYKRGAVISPFLPSAGNVNVLEAPLNRAGLSELIVRFYSYPKWKANAFVNYTRGPLNARWTIRIIGATSDQDHPVTGGFASVDNNVEHDLTLQYQGTWQTTWTLNVRNLLDAAPPFVFSQYNYDYTNGDPLGRVVEIGLKKRF
jgi:iron complex outermembrane receptor protein